MQRIVTAVYENGVLRLLDPLELPEHTYVQLHIQELSNANDAQVEHRQQLRQALVAAGLSVPATNPSASNHVPLSAERREQLAEVFAADYSLSSSIIEDREGRQVADYYADSSALVKRHVREPGTNWFRFLAASSTTTITTSRISSIEVVSAFNRRMREAAIKAADYAALVSDFDVICAAEYEFIEITDAVSLRARRLLESYPLRAYDAVQLASALVASEALVNAGLTPLIFLAADDRLLDAARNENLAVDNPNLHP